MKRALTVALVASLFMSLLGGIASAELLRGSVGDTTDHDRAVQVDHRRDVDDVGFRNILRRCRRVLADNAPSADAVEKCREFWKRWCEAHPRSRLCRRTDVPPPFDCRVVIDRVVELDHVSDRLWDKCGDTWKRWCETHPEKCRELWKRWCEAHPDSRMCPPPDIDPPDCRIVDRVTDRAPDRVCPVPIDPPVDPPKCVVVDGVEICRVPIDPPVCLHADQVTDVKCVPIVLPDSDPVDRPINGPVPTPDTPEGTPEDQTDRLTDKVSDDTHVRVSRADH